MGCMHSQVAESFAVDKPCPLMSYKAWRRKYIKQYQDMLYVHYNADGQSSPKHAVTVSEAIGYGMLISVYVDNQKDFDSLTRFYLHHRNKKSLMCWQQVCDGKRILTNPDPDAGGTGAATDGDMDIAYALLLAGKRWTDGMLLRGQQVSYRTLGLESCDAIYRHCINHTTHMPMIGDWVGGPDEMCGPVEGVCYFYISRPSDWMLSHFLLFSQEDDKNASGWSKSLEACIASLNAHVVNNPIGLFSDFTLHDPSDGLQKPVTKRVLERAEDIAYSYNSCRLPWRLAAYYHDTHDARILPTLNAMAAFFEAQEEIVAGYQLDGAPLADYTNACFSAPALALLKALNKDYKQVYDSIKENLAGGHGSYYGETILMLVQLQLKS